MTKETDTNTGKSSQNEERVLAREEISEPISGYERESADSENTGYNLSFVLSKFVSVANSIASLADNEIKRMEQIQEEKHLSSEQEMYMDRDFSWCFQENEK